jgi:uncharacterized protein
METRRWGKRTGLDIPRVSAGSARLPDDPELAAAVMRHAIDAGIRYIDASRAYRDSELKLARALKDGYREKVLLSTKWAPWAIRVEADDNTSADCLRRRLGEQLERLETDYVDFFQVWYVQHPEQFEAVTAKGGLLEGILKAKEEGLVRHIGFTTHDTPENVIGYLERIDWAETILVTYNLLNRQYAPVLRAAKERGLGTMVMNPMGGGKLAKHSRVLDIPSIIFAAAFEVSKHKKMRATGCLVKGTERIRTPRLYCPLHAAADNAHSRSQP